MTYIQAALEVLRSSQVPLSTQEITRRALERGLISPHGSTPQATMGAALYRHLEKADDLIKLGVPGAARTKSGTVRWKAVGD